MIINFWSQRGKENLCEFPRLDLDPRYNYKIALKKLYFKLLPRQEINLDDLFYLKCDLIDLSSHNLFQSLFNFSLDNNRYCHCITPTHINFFPLLNFTPEKPSFEIWRYPGDTEIFTDSFFVELEIKKW